MQENHQAAPSGFFLRYLRGWKINLWLSWNFHLRSNSIISVQAAMVLLFMKWTAWPKSGSRLQNQFYRATLFVVCLNPQKCRCNLQIPEQNCPSFSLSQPGKTIHLDGASKDELRILLQTANPFFPPLAWDDVVSPSSHQFSVVFAFFWEGGGL